MDQHGNTQSFVFYLVVFVVLYYIITLYSRNKEVGNESCLYVTTLTRMTKLYITNSPYFLKHEF